MISRRFEVNSDSDIDAAVAFVCGSGSDDGFERTIREKTEATRAIVDAVRERGDAALAEFTARFDRTELRPDQFEVSSDELDRASGQVDAALLESIRRAHETIRSFHEKQSRSSWETRHEDGSVTGQRVTPLESAGVYVPGGTAFYPSSVLMNIVPAKVAGVASVTMVSPPSFNGTIHPVVLAAAKIAGVDRVFRVGGAQAVAALAYGTETLPQVVKITGPGNTFVAVAKRLVQHVCSIDTEAGPSEVTVIADESAAPALVASELLAQAEHDVEACSVLVTPSRKLAGAVQEALASAVGSLSRADIIRQSLASRGGTVLVRDMADCIRISNLIAPEHLAVYTASPRETLKGITNAGAIMLGGSTSVVHGDYCAGPNHILPTGRRARYASPLSSEDFQKVSSIIEFSPERAAGVAADVMRMARAEELTAHARAAELRQ